MLMVTYMRLIPGTPAVNERFRTFRRAYPVVRKGNVGRRIFTHPGIPFKTRQGVTDTVDPAKPWLFSEVHTHETLNDVLSVVFQRNSLFEGADGRPPSQILADGPPGAPCIDCEDGIGLPAHRPGDVR